jgi:hypothetical protein
VTGKALLAVIIAVVLFVVGYACYLKELICLWDVDI